MRFPRSCGTLVHPTSFPSDYGMGDLGPSAREFIDFLAATGQSIWQVLPLTPVHSGNSPYASYSAFAGNPYLISPEILCDK
ncbi:MAG: 4-alpha-glucanotransferase, partial [Balneolaceae bacterium]